MYWTIGLSSGAGINFADYFLLIKFELMVFEGHFAT